MSYDNATNIYTLTDELPLLVATALLLPIIQLFPLRAWCMSGERPSRISGAYTRSCASSG